MPFPGGGGTLVRFRKKEESFSPELAVLVLVRSPSGQCNSPKSHTGTNNGSYPQWPVIQLQWEWKCLPPNQTRMSLGGIANVASHGQSWFR